MQTEQALAIHRSFRSVRWTICALMGFPWVIHAESLTDALQMAIDALAASGEYTGFALEFVDKPGFRPHVVGLIGFDFAKYVPDH